LKSLKFEFIYYENQIFKIHENILKLSLSLKKDIFLQTPIELRKDKEFIKKLVQWNGMILEYLCDEFKIDEEICYLCYKQNKSSIKYIDIKYLFSNDKFYGKVMKIPKFKSLNHFVDIFFY
jgi:hypothetical protein